MGYTLSLTMILDHFDDAIMSVGVFPLIKTWILSQLVFLSTNWVLMKMTSLSFLWAGFVLKSRILSWIKLGRSFIYLNQFPSINLNLGRVTFFIDQLFVGLRLSFLPIIWNCFSIFWYSTIPIFPKLLLNIVIWLDSLEGIQTWTDKGRVHLLMILDLFSTVFWLRIF